MTNWHQTQQGGLQRATVAGSRAARAGGRAARWQPARALACDAGGRAQKKGHARPWRGTAGAISGHRYMVTCSPTYACQAQAQAQAIDSNAYVQPPATVTGYAQAIGSRSSPPAIDCRAPAPVRSAAARRPQIDGSATLAHAPSDNPGDFAHSAPGKLAKGEPMNQITLTDQTKNAIRKAAAKAYTKHYNPNLMYYQIEHQPGISIQTMITLAQKTMTRPDSMDSYRFEYCLRDAIESWLKDERRTLKATAGGPTWISWTSWGRGSRTFWAYLTPEQRGERRARAAAAAAAEAEREQAAAERARRLVEAVRIHLQLPDAAAAIDEIQAVTDHGSRVYDDLRRACSVVVKDSE